MPASALRGAGGDFLELRRLDELAVEPRVLGAPPKAAVMPLIPPPTTRIVWFVAITVAIVPPC